MRELLILLCLLYILPSRALHCHKVHAPTRSFRREPTLNAEAGNSVSDISQTAYQLKKSLVQAVSEFRELKEQDGDVSIDFGVKGGELNATSRAPQKIDFYSISQKVGDKANEILTICDKLSEFSPIENPTRFLGDKENGDKAPLDGPWKSLFTTAADANFSKNSTRGAATAQNIVSGTKGSIRNVIDFCTKEDGTEPVLKQLNVVIKATAVSPKRVELQFRYAKAVFTKFFFLKRRWSLYIPVPGPFITRCIVFVSRIFRLGRKGAKKVPKGFFDIKYLDKDLRIHKTGEDNLFVQVRETWDLAKPLLS
mmetsp:Transcript_6409/g.9436  ORF Transcript_6409/g.9436 Transcript_6409/m.9436 type:complete len:310 (+) Transcript_6409:82-1011(+)